VVVELDAALPLGRFNDEIVVRTTSAAQPTITVSVLGTIEGDIAVLPPQVTFGVTRGALVEPRELFVRNRGRRPVAVTRVAVPAGITYELSTVEPGIEYRLNLRLRAGLLVDAGAHTLEVVRPGFESARRDFEIDSGEQLRLDVELAEAAVAVN